MVGPDSDIISNASTPIALNQTIPVSNFRHKMGMTPNVEDGTEGMLGIGSDPLNDNELQAPM